MSFSSVKQITCAVLISIISTYGTQAEEGNTIVERPFKLSKKTDDLLATYCYDCHEDGTEKGDIRLDNLAEIKITQRLDLLNRMQEQIYFGHMPPKKKDQPSPAERDSLLAFISDELKLYSASTLEGKLQKPEYGNYIDHEKLFSGKYKDQPGFTHDRRWLISEYIFNAKFQRMLMNEANFQKGKQRLPLLGAKNIPGLNLANPFLLPTAAGVRYYANEDFTGGHLSSMLTNAQNTAEFITNTLVQRKKGAFLPAIGQIMALEDQQQLKLAARRQFLGNFIAKYCEEIYSNKHESLLPKYIPVKINEIKQLEKGEKYKKAPVHVAFYTIKSLNGEQAIHQLLLDPLQSKKSDAELQEICAKIWFYNGDFERDIQGRVTILRDYMPELRKRVIDDKGRGIRPLIYTPLAEAEMQIIKTSIMKHRKHGDFYKDIIEKCVKGWEDDFEKERIAAGLPSDKLLRDLIDQLFVQILERKPTSTEADEHLTLLQSYIGKLGKIKAIQKLIQTFILSSEFSYRQEFGHGTPDDHGRKMLSPRDASYALAYALTDQSPDPELVKAAERGKLNTRDDYKREVLRMLENRNSHYLIDPILTDANYVNNHTNASIRKLRFFREFFGYPAALNVFKDEKRFGLDRLGEATFRLINETDRLVEHILENDKDVFEELLTTEKFYVYHDGDNQRMQEASDRIKSIYAYFKDLDWKNFTNDDLVKHADFLRKVKMRTVNPDNLAARTRQGSTLQLFKISMESITARLDKGQKEAAPFDLYRGYGYDFMVAYNVAMFYNISLENWDYQTIQPAKVANRKGLLTSPAWLIANAQNTETDPIHRGKWVREKLLADTIPNVPITVDAVIPENHGQTLRSRLAGATEVKMCWRCHEAMNPLGYAFESYDDFGRFRSVEALEYPDKLIKKNSDKPTLLTDTRDSYQTLPVNAKGFLKGTRDASLDGEIKDALDLVERLGKSQRVRQSIIRHAFRYFMGRNEVLSDSKSLIDAEQAYIKSNGSFDAVIVSLLTSDSFIYRKPIEN